MPRTAGLHPQFEGKKKVTGAGVTRIQPLGPRVALIPHAAHVAGWRKAS